MKGDDWLRFVKSKRPQYSTNHKNLIQQFANKGSSSTDYAQFGPVYQLFMYAVLIGFHKGERIPLPNSGKEKQDFLEIGKWQPDGLVNYLLMLLISDELIRKEANLDFNEMEDLESGEVEKRFNHLIKVMEEFANGGLGVISEEFENNPDQFNDSFAFVLLLRKSL